MAATSTSAVTFRGRTAWARNVAAPLRDFLNTETGGAVALLAATVAALVWANSPWSHSYDSVWGTELSIRLGDASIAMDLRHWVNEGLMTFFFLVVGLEAKRELELGQLRERRRLAALSVMSVAAMASAVGVYLAFNAGGGGAHGWGAAMSTDTAFALGVLALVAPTGTRLGKPLGTMAGAALVTRSLLRGIGRGLSWPVIAGGGVVNGIGFTVSLLISSIAFRGQSLDEAKLGVLAAALIATVGGWAAFRVIRRLPPEVRARQISRTADDLVDLSDDVDPACSHHCSLAMTFAP